MNRLKKQKELKKYCEILTNKVIGMTIPVNKPKDWTSFDVVKKMRNITKFKKVGHAGTLDPFATGLLILGFGKHTKKLEIYSAKKINGTRLYKYARKGIEVKRKPIEINIYSIDILSYINNILKLKVECSTGTYIRVLANDIGEKLGCYGHAKELLRSKIGTYSVDDSFQIEEFAEEWKSLEI
jgi:tRNA U55 pseudouridine synthase TruB